MGSVVHAKSVSARPNFAMLVYPVITMDPQFTHHGIRSNTSPFSGK